VNFKYYWPLVAGVLLAQAPCLAQAEYRGGSNYYFYEGVPYGDGNGYGVITDYYLPTVASTVTSQIASIPGFRSDKSK